MASFGSGVYLWAGRGGLLTCSPTRTMCGGRGNECSQRKATAASQHLLNLLLSVRGKGQSQDLNPELLPPPSGFFHLHSVVTPEGSGQGWDPVTRAGGRAGAETQNPNRIPTQNPSERGAGLRTSRTLAAPCSVDLGWAWMTSDPRWVGPGCSV